MVHRLLDSQNKTPQMRFVGLHSLQPFNKVTGPYPGGVHLSSREQIISMKRQKKLVSFFSKTVAISDELIEDGGKHSSLSSVTIILDVIL